MKAFNPLQRSACLAAIVFLLGISPLKAQDIQLHINYLQGIRYTATWDAFKGGTELSADYLLTRPSGMKYTAGLDLRTVQWGTQASLSLGAIRTLGSRFELGAEVQHGLALFRENSLYVLGAEAKAHYLFLQKEKITVGASLGTRYSICPGYKAYSQIYHLTEIPMGVFIRF
jgi:hypothetical protein